VVVLVGAVVAAIWAGLANRTPYGQIGRGGMSLDEPARPAVAPTFAVAESEREAEIRQMLEARSRRRVARGQPAGDVEAELAELLASRPRTAADAGLVAEVRDLVVARNARRARAGKPPLDVEAEVARQLRDLT
jgi:hypothetical protein